MIITIDGPSGTGKTTVAKEVAKRLRFAYFDTGAMYRAVAWKLLHEKISVDDIPSIEDMLKHFSFRIQETAGEPRYFCGIYDVTQDIRSQKVIKIVSAVAALLPVREALWKVQRDFAAQDDVVFEGRDLGTVVFPNAEVKIFLTANPQVRAKRRLDELKVKNPKEAAKMDQKKMIADMKRRDTLDSTRELAPLKCPEDALQIDTTDLTLNEVVERILSYKMEKQPP